MVKNCILKRQYEIYIRKDKKKKLEFQGRVMLIFNCYVVYTNVDIERHTVTYVFGKYFFTRHYYFLTSENRTIRYFFGDVRIIYILDKFFFLLRLVFYHYNITISIIYSLFSIKTLDPDYTIFF